MLLLLPFIAYLIGFVAAIGQNAIVGFTQGKFLLGSRRAAVHVLVDSSDWKGVVRVARDLAADFGRVTGLNGTVTVNANATVNATSAAWQKRSPQFRPPPTQAPPAAAAGGTIIAGTIGKSPLIDQLIKAGKIDVSGVKGKWEAFTSQIVASPVPGVAQALVIVGEYPNYQLGSEFATYIYQKEMISVELFTVSMIFRSRLASLPGTGGRMRRQRSTNPSMHSTPKKSRDLHPSSTVESSSMTRHQR